MSPRPPNLLVSAATSSSRRDYQILTPRTPHSRAGRAEEGYTEIELEQGGQDDNDTHYSGTQHQSEPLLASSSSDTFPPSGIRARGDDQEFRTGHASALERVVKSAMKHAGLALGSLLALILFFMIIVAYREPEVMMEAIGANKTPLGSVDELQTGTSEPAAVPSPTQSSAAATVTALDEHIISYAQYDHFPLYPHQYRDECDKLMSGLIPPAPYWSGDKDVIHHNTVDPGNDPTPEGARTSICTSTITYQLDGYVGLLADLALMAQAAALAREQNRTFLVDDTYWNRGKWNAHFQDVRSRQPGPEPGCRVPPPEELVACPRNARHWVVNSRTAKFHFGHRFSEEYENPRAHQLNRLKPIFERARESLTHTIRPNAATASLIRSLRSEMASMFPSPLPLHSAVMTSDDSIPLESDPGQYVGVHIRHGDGRSMSWKYHGKHLPMDEYAQAAMDTFARLFSSNSSEDVASDATGPAADGPPAVIYLASDDPTALDSLSPLLPPHVIVTSLAQSKEPALKGLASPREYKQAEFNELEEIERIRLTTGMIIDFAMLSGFWAWDNELLPGAVVCGIASSVCRLSAAGLGWDRAFGHGFSNHDEGTMDKDRKRWVEIDQKGAIIPAWEAFELF